MILRNVADELIRSVSATVNTNDGRYDPLYVEQLIPHLREQSIKIDYFGDRTRAASRRLDYSLVQSFTVQKDVVQDNALDYITFTSPNAVSISRMLNGFIYVGHKNKSISFIQLFNREDVANMTARGLFTNGKVIGYIWEGGKILVFGSKMILELNVRGIIADPTKVPGFLIETDDYPVSESLMLIMTDLFKANQNVNMNRTTDITEDGKETIR